MFIILIESSFGTCNNINYGYGFPGLCAMLSGQPSESEDKWIKFYLLFFYPAYSVQGCRKTDGLSLNFLLKIMSNNIVQNTGYIHCVHPLAYSGQSPARYTRNRDHVFILPTDPRCHQHSTFSGFRLYFSGNGRTRSDCLLYGGTLSQIT